ncbi:MAG: CopG family transcriptional regulator [Candidatus Auribacterota bacterium]|nr:CopG family transcriptional regulator [Candidatus Auribacterota bacterium]
MNTNKKESIISFKADDSLQKALSLVPNRSEFIRTAILSALEHICPLCQGKGILTPSQKSHWNKFELNHKVQQCHECNAPYIICSFNAEHTEAAH